MESIEQIPMSHLVDLAWLFRMGMIGWQADARLNYTQYAQMHNLQQVLVQVNSKNYKSKKPQPFSKMFPEHHELATLGKKKNLAERWSLAAKTLGVKDADKR